MGKEGEKMAMAITIIRFYVRNILQKSIRVKSRISTSLLHVKVHYFIRIRIRNKSLIIEAPESESDRQSKRLKMVH